MAPTVGTDVETRSYNFYLVRFCMYIEWDILVFGYFKVGLSVQFHISFVASEVGGIFHGGLGVQHTRVPSARIIWARCPAGTVTVCNCTSLLYKKSEVMK